MNKIPEAKNVYVDSNNRLILTSGTIEGAKFIKKFSSQKRAIKFMQENSQRVLIPNSKIIYYYRGNGDS